MSKMITTIIVLMSLLGCSHKPTMLQQIQALQNDDQQFESQGDSPSEGMAMIAKLRQLQPTKPSVKNRSELTHSTASSNKKTLTICKDLQAENLLQTNRVGLQWHYQQQQAVPDPMQQQQLYQRFDPTASQVTICVGPAGKAESVMDVISAKIRAQHIKALLDVTGQTIALHYMPTLPADSVSIVWGYDDV